MKLSTSLFGKPNQTLANTVHHNLINSQFYFGIEVVHPSSTIRCLCYYLTIQSEMVFQTKSIRSISLTNLEQIGVQALPGKRKDLEYMALPLRPGSSGEGGVGHASYLSTIYSLFVELKKSHRGLYLVYLTLHVRVRDCT